MSEKELRGQIEVMREALAQEAEPKFGPFWEARRACLPLFKETIHPAIRATLWGEFRELSDQARRLKGMFEEEAQFAIVQIEGAIAAVEESFAQRSEKRVPPEPAHQCRGLDQLSYCERQGEITLCSTLLGRITELRRELIKTEMRMREKNRLFQRIGAIGDAIFEVRTGLIEEVSGQFLGDVERFLEGEVARSDVMGMQAMAKILTLTQEAFEMTREQLGRAWG
jgi:hypothetical protein